jgi:hypothetical protein
MIKLSHFSDKEIQTIKDYSLPDKENMKPRGLWVSVDGEYNWQEWCNDNDFDDLTKKYHYQVNLKQDSGILLLNSNDAILDFTKRYSLAAPTSDFHAINWSAVTKEYSGILITPYSWELRLDRRVSWYYPWDCASGCIWSAGAIESFSLRRPPIIPQLTGT